MGRLFLDNNATTALVPAAKQAMLTAMEVIGNPSSVHWEGRAARAMIENARATIQDMLAAPRDSVIFTSGGTEAINLALWGMVRRAQPVQRIFVTATEHEAVRASSQAIADAGLCIVETIPVRQTGEVDADWLAHRLGTYDARKEGPFLAVIMLANNETGVINDIAALAPVIFQAGGVLCVDAVQAVGKIPVNFLEIRADLMAVSAHKLGGPKGVGALLVKPGLPLAPILQGGGQELRRRSGTENLISIAGFGAACAALDLPGQEALRPVCTHLASGLRALDVEGVTIWGEGCCARLPNTLCFSAPGFASETQMMAMDLAGIAVSAGSACSSGKIATSYVLRAMGASDAQAQSCLRVSFAPSQGIPHADKFLHEWDTAYARIRKTKAA